jgi:hypothetical protein
MPREVDDARRLDLRASEAAVAPRALGTVAVLDVVVARALLTLFAPVNRGVLTVAAWLRVAYAAVFLVAATSRSAATAQGNTDITDAGPTDRSATR